MYKLIQSVRFNDQCSTISHFIMLLETAFYKELSQRKGWWGKWERKSR